MQECISKEEETAAEGTTPDDAKEAKFEVYYLLKINRQLKIIRCSFA